MSDEIKFCKYCGRKIAANAKFCSYCGGEQGAFISQDNSNQKTDSTGVFSKKPETAAGEHISETTTDLDIKAIQALQDQKTEQNQDQEPAPISAEAIADIVHEQMNQIKEAHTEETPSSFPPFKPAHAEDNTVEIPHINQTASSQYTMRSDTEEDNEEEPGKNGPGKIILIILLIIVLLIGGLLGASYLFRDKLSSSWGSHFPMELPFGYQLDIPWLHEDTKTDPAPVISAVPKPTAVPAATASAIATAAPTPTPTPTASAITADDKTVSINTFKLAYLSYLKAINDQDLTQISHVSDSQRSTWETRIKKYNTGYTYVNNVIQVDTDSYSLEEVSGVLTATYKTYVSNTGASRKDGTKFENIVVDKVTAQKINGEWIITDAKQIKDNDIGKNLSDIK